MYVSSAAGFDGYTYLYVAVTSSQLLDCMARVKRSETNPGLVTGKVNSFISIALCIWIDRTMYVNWSHYVYESITHAVQVPYHDNNICK